MTETTSNRGQWNLSSLLGLTCAELDGVTQTPLALIILNQSFVGNKKLLPILWKSASLRICADGGGNRLYDAYSDSIDELRSFVPDYICGDLDSLRPDVSEFYNSSGCEVQSVPDQDSNDFMKCLDIVRRISKTEEREYDVIALGALGGRFDQSMANINQMFVLRDERRVYLFSEESAAFLLTEGTHHITVDKTLEGPTCGLIPISGPVTCTTSGLVWNLNQSETYFGGLLSSSNAFQDTGNVVTVTTDRPLVWTCAIQFIDDARVKEFAEDHFRKDICDLFLLDVLKKKEKTLITPWNN